MVLSVNTLAAGRAGRGAPQVRRLSSVGSWRHLLRSHSCTTILPRMLGWIEQWELNSPGAVNLMDTLFPWRIRFVDQPSDETSDTVRAGASRVKGPHQGMLGYASLRLGVLARVCPRRPDAVKPHRPRPRLRATAISRQRLVAFGTLTDNFIHRLELSRSAACVYQSDLRSRRRARGGQPILRLFVSARALVRTEPVAVVAAHKRKSWIPVS
jgi:hypothetical protein